MNSDEEDKIGGILPYLGFDFVWKHMFKEHTWGTFGFEALRTNESIV